MTVTHVAQRRVRAVAVAAALALTLTACSSDDEGASGSGGSGEAPEIALAVQGAPNSFDPAQLSDGQQTFIWGSIFDTLLVRENTTGDVVPGAAESWEYSEDGLTLTLTLRGGMTFSDGSPVTAADAAATMQRTKDTAGLQQGKFASVDEISAPDDSTLVITFVEHDPAFLPTLAYAPGAIGQESSLDSGSITTDPVGSGPYTLDTSATVPGTTYVLERRDDHWDAESFPYDKVTVRVLPDPTAAFNALQAGEIDAATVRSQQLQALGEGFTQTPIEAQAVTLINFLDRGGEKFEALGDERVRQAINFAIDRDGILEALLQGAGRSSTQIFNPLNAVYDESLDSTYAYDPEKAKQLLAEAGYADGLTLQIPSTYVTTALEPTLSQQMADVGITLDWVAVPAQQAQSVLQSGDFGIALQAVGFSAFERDSRDYFAPGGFYNPRNYTDPTLDGLFDEVAVTVDPDEALSVYRSINEYAVEQALVAPIVHNGTTWVTTEAVTYLDNGANGIQSLRLFGFDPAQQN